MRQYRTVLLLLVGILIHMGAHAEKSMAPEQVEGAIRVDAEGVIELFQTQPGLIIIDARRAEEFHKGHIEGAHNLLDVEMDQQQLQQLAPSTTTPLLFYCNGPRCLRSSNAITKAHSWGYQNLYWFRGGWSSWMQNHFPIAY